MFRKIISTSNDPAMTILRVMLGITFFAHGSSYMLGWFGGFGFQGTLAVFQRLGIPAPLGVLAMSAELFGGIGLILGLLSRIAALGIMTDMIVAISILNHKNGFFMNWFGKQKGEGMEYHLLVIAICVAVLIKGAGVFSLDYLITDKKTGVAASTSASKTDLPI